MNQTTIGHELFDNIREVRKYLRKAQYELPKLSGKLSKENLKTFFC